MVDFLIISMRSTKNGVEIYPKFRLYPKSQDLMIRGGDFYAVWIEELSLWSTNEDDALSIIDSELRKRADEYAEKHPDTHVNVLYTWDSSSGSIDAWHKYCQKQKRDSFVMLDESLVFSNTNTTKQDYASKRLPYPLEKGSISAYDKLISTLYNEEERHKLEWAIGAIVTGDSKHIQKFLVLYGAAGTGKSTILNIVQQLFDGYYSVFDAKALGTGNNQFALEAFKKNPLVAIQHDGDLSRIEDNTRLNSLVSHELMTVNEKHKGLYENRFKCFLFMGTNKPVKITDGKSGIIRRLIDVKPTGNKVSHRKYDELMDKIGFELGAIADHCEQLYLDMGKSYYDSYKPIDMMFKTDPFFNFVEDQYLIFKEEDGVSLKQAYAIYKEYCKETGAEYVLQMYKFREELKNYFRNFEDIHYDGDVRVRSYFSGFISDKFDISKTGTKEKIDDVPDWLKLKSKKSKFDILCADCLAQYTTPSEKPLSTWAEVKTTLKDLDTKQIHYVKVPLNHIVIDFDLKDETGQKSKDINIKAASKFPKTYAEFSKSGNGLHLHYIFEGDPETLSSVYSEGIEIKVFRGKSSLRRKLSFCNDEDVAIISSGLPRKEQKVVTKKQLEDADHLYNRIKKCLRKEVEPYATKPLVELIKTSLDEAYASGMTYDATPLRQAILQFALSSTHHANECIKMVNEMKFASEEIGRSDKYEEEAELIFFDVEVFPNVFIVVYSKLDTDSQIAKDILETLEKKDRNRLQTLLSSIPKVRLINPSRNEIEDLISPRHKLVGFNNRRYDNHILYAWIMGYNNGQLFDLSQKIINQSKNAFFGEAYNLSFADIFDFASKKQSLKKWEIELGTYHKEFGYSWDKDLPKEKWNEAADYCCNDVEATIATWFACQEDFVARQVLADISGLSVNDTTRMHTTKIIFGGDKNPDLVYTDLSEMFPGYTFEFGKSSYRGEDPGEGGYVYSEPGMYSNVALLDIASMHPSSIEALNLFGDYTSRFSDIKNARIYIKHKDFDKAGQLLNGAFKPYLKDKSKAKALAQALKIVINSVYGYTTATFDNPFKDPRNVDNIVAKRGALFMINLKHEVQDRGFKVAHIKTDSIKIPDATPEIIQFVKDYGKKYGYTFEHEATYSKMCLVNDAVYIAKHIDAPWEEDAGKWTATGAQFQVPYVFKTLFSKEPLIFDDFCETKSVTSQLYLDFNEDLPEDEHNYVFVGKVGRFTPVKPGCGGAILYREKDGKYYAATGSKGYRWVESETLRVYNNWRELVDEHYYISQVDEAIKDISKFGDFEWFKN